MRKIYWGVFGLAASAASMALTAGPASAFQVAPSHLDASPVEQVRVVCNEWGRCWQTGPRYYRQGYYGRRHYGGYRDGYRGRYYDRPGVSIRVPGAGVRFY